MERWRDCVMDGLRDSGGERLRDGGMGKSVKMREGKILRLVDGKCDYWTQGMIGVDCELIHPTFDIQRQ